MRVALFDLDNTLLDGDSDHAWGDFLAERGLVDAKAHKSANDEFYRQYQAGTLDIMEYLEFSFHFLTQHPVEQLHAWRSEFVEQKIKPMILPKGQTLVKRHQEQGDLCVIITATNDFVTTPIAPLFGIDHLIAVRAEQTESGYTGKVAGIPSYQEGKVTRFEAWLKEQGITPTQTVFYSDSQTDLPLLEYADMAIATNPNESLKRIAEEKVWPILELR